MISLYGFYFQLVKIYHRLFFYFLDYYIIMSQTIKQKIGQIGENLAVKHLKKEKQK